MNLKKRILVAPLNWGIGHATRCIPILNGLISSGFEPLIASDGDALALLKKEFPKLKFFELPSYNIRYPKKAKLLKLKLIKDAPRIRKAIKQEKKIVQALVENYAISGIISDNRFGVYHKRIPSVFITHQLRVLSGSTTWFSTKINQNMIKPFDQCWIPDSQEPPNLSGQLSRLKKDIIPTQFIGALSRFKKRNVPKQFDLLVLLSGPEPQRTLLENKLLSMLKNYNGKVCFVRGVIESNQTTRKIDHITLVNFMQTEALEKTLNSSNLILSRSGYSTILDLAKLQKKAFFIPTPGQFEQEYLANYLNKQNIAPYCKQEDFTIDMLLEVENYEGFTKLNSEFDLEQLFNLF